MERYVYFEEVVTYNHEVKVEVDSEEMLDKALENIQNEIMSGAIKESGDVLHRLLKDGIRKAELIKDGSPDVEISII